MKQKVQLKDIASYSKGQQINGDKLLEDGMYDYLNGGIYPSGKWNSYNVDGNTITISEGGNSSGYVNYMNQPFWCGAHCYYLFDTVGDIKYLYYALKSQQDRIMQIRSGVCMPNIKKVDLGNFEFIFDDDVLVQHQVVEVLDKIYCIIKQYKYQLVDLDNLIKSRFVEMFGDLKRNDKQWPILPFMDFATIDTTMIHDFEEYKNYPHIGIDSIEKETGNILDYRTVQEDGVISGKYLFTPGHIIYSKIRPNLNKVALPNFKGVCSADAYPILPKKEQCNRIFLAYVMRSQVFLDYILAFSSRTNLPKVNKKQVEGFCCPIPDIALQEQFSAFVHQTDKLKLTAEESLKKLEVMQKALMQQYFC